jgi:hypothetical protein
LQAGEGQRVAVIIPLEVVVVIYRAMTVGALVITQGTGLVSLPF